jgi:tetratricopeptide (TPR) repeat protein
LSQCDILIEFQPFYKTQYPSFLFCSPTYNGLGAALRDQKKLEQAVAAYQKAIELDPKGYLINDPYIHQELHFI